MENTLNLSLDIDRIVELTCDRGGLNSFENIVDKTLSSYRL